MTKQIKEYLAFLEQFFSTEHSKEEIAEFREKLLERIQFYQHERLIHLIVTMSFGVFFLIALSLYLTTNLIGTLILAILFLILLVPYIKHYYFLENSVQKMYLYYYRAAE